MPSWFCDADDGSNHSTTTKEPELLHHAAGNAQLPNTTRPIVKEDIVLVVSFYRDILFAFGPTAHTLNI